MINTILFPTPFWRSYMYMYIMIYHVKLQNPEHNMLQPHNNSFSCQKLAYLDLIYYFIMSPYPSYLQFSEQKLNFECTVCIWSLENMVTEHFFTEPLITVNAFCSSNVNCWNKFLSDKFRSFVYRYVEK
jgi:hypothetical protein